MKLLILLLFPLMLSAQTFKEYRINHYQSDGSTDTISWEYIFDTTRELIVYIDTGGYQALTIGYRPIQIIDHNVQWMYGYKVCKKETIKGKPINGRYSYDCVLLNDKKKPFSKEYMKLLNFTK